MPGDQCKECHSCEDKTTGWSFPVISRRYEITADFLFHWLSQSLSPFLRCSLSLRHKNYVVKVLVGLGTTISCPLHFDQLWLSVVGSGCCKEKLSLTQVGAALTRGLRKSIYNAVRNYASLVSKFRIMLAGKCFSKRSKTSQNE